MSEEEAIEKMKEYARMGDTEAAHGYADDLLCSFLRQCGYERLVEAYDKVDKWYA